MINPVALMLRGSMYGSNVLRIGVKIKLEGISLRGRLYCSFIIFSNAVFHSDFSACALLGQKDRFVIRRIYFSWRGISAISSFDDDFVCFL